MAHEFPDELPGGKMVRLGVTAIAVFIGLLLLAEAKPWDKVQPFLDKVPVVGKWIGSK